MTDQQAAATQHAPRREDIARFGEATQALVAALDKFDNSMQAGNSSNSQIHINMGGLSVGVALGASVICLILICLMGVGMMLMHQSNRAELRQQAQNAADREQAWVQVWTQRVEQLKREYGK